MRKIFILIVAVFVCVNLLTAQTNADTCSYKDDISVSVYFRQGKTSLDLNFRNNGKSLDRFGSSFDSVARLKPENIKGIRIFAAASPEGSKILNTRLAKERATRIVSYLRNRFGLKQTHFDIVCYGPDWDGLSMRVKDYDVPNKKQVIDILDNVPEWIMKDGVIVDGKKKRLMCLDQGRSWNYMLQHIYPDLRFSSVTIHFIEDDKPQKVQPDVVPLTLQSNCDTSTKDLMLSPIPSIYTKQCSHFFLAVKNNLLEDAILVPNIALEAYLGKSWSLSGNWRYAWWYSDRKHRYWQTYGGELELRRWLTSQDPYRPLLGFHVGLYGQMLTYDVMLKSEKGYQGAKWHYGAGVAVGYSLPLKHNFFIDFNIGVGYLGGTYKEYRSGEKCYPWLATKTLNYFGPTKAEISIGYLIDLKSCKKLKKF